MLAEIDEATQLLTWDGDDLIVWNYPAEKEFEIQRMRSRGQSKSERKVDAARSNGSKGGRPKEKQEGDDKSDNPTETQRNNPTITQQENPTETQRKEGKGKEVEEELEVEGEEEPPPTPPPAAKAESSAEIFSERWNALPDPFPAVRAMSSARRKHLNARLSEPFWRENWMEALDLMAELPFCRGSNDRNWIADVDFFLRPDSVAKIMEGRYSDQPAKTGQLWVAGDPIDYKKLAAETLAGEQETEEARLAREFLQ